MTHRVIEVSRHRHPGSGLEIFVFAQVNAASVTPLFVLLTNSEVAKAAVEFMQHGIDVVWEDAA